MNVSKDAQDKIVELQMLEQNMQSFAIQKQKFQISLSEIDNAISELDKSKEKEAYKIIGDVIIRSKKEDLEKDLNDKKKIIELRITNLEKQELKIKEKAEELQKEVMKIIENEKSKRVK